MALSKPMKQSSVVEEADSENLDWKKELLQKDLLKQLSLNETKPAKMFSKESAVNGSTNKKSANPKKRASKKEPTTPKKKEIDVSAANETEDSILESLERNKDDIRVWMSYFKCCKEAGNYDAVSDKLSEMISHHSEKTSAWKFAACWEFEERNSIQKARDVLQRALRVHSNSTELHAEVFRLEMLYSSKMKKEAAVALKSNPDFKPDDVTELAIKGEIVKAAYEASTKMIRDVEFLEILLKISKEYPDNEFMETKIFQDMLDLYPDSELTWKTLAQRSFEGLPCLHDPTKENGNTEVELVGEPEVVGKSTSLKARIQKSVDIYNHAVSKINTVDMWSYYLDFVMDMYSDLSVLKNFKTKLFRNTLEAAGNASKLSEKYYPIYLDNLRETNAKDKKIREVLKQATDNYPSNYDFWETRLLYHIRKSLSQSTIAIFREAITNLEHVPAEKILSLWRKMYVFYLAKYPKKVKKFFAEGLSRGGEIRQLLKPLYIEYITLTEGIGAARKIFETSDILTPPCLALLQKMAELEGMQPDTSMKAIRRCHELACTHFGQNNIDVWMNYVKFELKSGEPPRASLIYYRAIKVLKGRQLDTFKSECSNYYVTPVESSDI